MPTPPYVLSVVGPDHIANWDGMAPDDYRARRGRWQDAIVATLDAHYPGLAAAVTHSAFNTALSVQQYLNAPGGAVYGFAPTPARCGKHSPRTVVPGLYLASAYAGLGGYSGVIAGRGRLCRSDSGRAPIGRDCPGAMPPAPCRSPRQLRLG